MKNTTTTRYLPETGYIRQSQLLEIVPFSAATLWRNVANGSFPSPVKLSARVTAWRAEDIRSWMDLREM
jgi:predicted DNA-binding transcriptional regulator AlpA